MTFMLKNSEGMKDKQILMTGATGFLGKDILKHLHQQEFLVDTMGRDKSSTYHFDFLNPQNLLIDKRYPLVVHVAGKAHTVPKNALEEKQFFDINLEGTKRLCTSLIESNAAPDAFIFISSVAVYGVEKGENVSEEHALRGHTPYAKSKILAEAWLSQWAQTNRINLTILRLPLIAGYNPPGNLGAMINGIRSGRYLSIGQANARKSMVWAGDISTLIPQLSSTNGIFNLTDGHHPTFQELEAIISQSLGKKRPISIPIFLAKVISKVGDMFGHFPINSDKLNKLTSTLTFDDSKARKLLNWKPSSVIDKLKETL